MHSSFVLVSDSSHGFGIIFLITTHHRLSASFMNSIMNDKSEYEIFNLIHM
jgi:hypothetical protein